MFRLLKCKAVPENGDGIILEDDVEYEQCPMDDNLQDQLRLV